MALIYQTDFLTTLAYLMGEKSVNSSTSSSRGDFVQTTLNEVYGAYPWLFARKKQSLTISSGIATLPTDYDPRHFSYAKFASGDIDVRLNPISDYEDGTIVDGDRASWIEPVPSGDGTRFVVRTKDSDVSTLLFRYQGITPTLDSAGTIGTPYPNKQTIALGARRWVKLAQNPDADISQDSALFKQSLAQDIAAVQVPTPRQSRRSRQSIASRYTGDE